MNIAALLTGDVIGGAGMELASSMLKGVFRDGSSFSGILDNLSGSSNKVKVDDLDLSAKEINELNNIREFAMNKGLKDIKVEIDGRQFSLNVKDNSLIALVS